jgi:hypothetical protein
MPNFGKNAPLGRIHGKIGQTSRNSNPGPGQYNENVTVMRQKSPSYKIGSSTQRAKMQSELVPGPGSYTVKSKLGEENPKYSIGEKHEGKNSNLNPGPGKYNPNDSYLRQSSPARTIPKGQRGGSISKDQLLSPGPGAYDGRNNRYVNLSYTIPEGERMSPMSKDLKMNPGPGNYELGKPFGKDTIHVSDNHS